MRYLCTIYTCDYTFSGKTGFVGTEPAFDEPVARVVVSGANARQAAAQAYVRCVGKQRAQFLRQNLLAPGKVIALETSRKAIAISLRKVSRRIGECYEMDNLREAWSIKVETVNPANPVPRQLRRLRLPHAVLLRHLSHPTLPS